MVIGITGQTGAGKSTVCSFAGSLGFSTVNADSVAREALLPGSECLKALAEFFGYDIIDENGCCKRDVLAQRAFSDPDSTQKLNSLTHPWIISKSREYIEDLKHKHITAILFDAPQLFESGGEILCDKVIAVTADKDVRLDRIMQRDNISREKALLRINAQHDESYYTQKADFIINGGQNKEKVRENFLNIIKQLGIIMEC